MKTFEIRTLSEFHERVKATGKYLAVFRGEPSAEYALRSTFGRFAAINPVRNTVATERWGLARFQRESVPYLDQVPEDDWEWLAVAQHHGLPTRLLDWTKNALVAAFFARPAQSADSVIYVLNQAALTEPPRDRSPFDVDKDYLFFPRHSARRIEAQSGLFTVHHRPQDVVEIRSLERWLLKAEVWPELASMLRVYGFRRSMLFPGLDSVCQEIREWTIWRTPEEKFDAEMTERWKKNKRYGLDDDEPPALPAPKRE